MSAEGDLWSAWCSLCHRFVAEETSEAVMKESWAWHWALDHKTPELVQ